MSASGRVNGQHGVLLGPPLPSASSDPRDCPLLPARRSRPPRQPRPRCLPPGHPHPDLFPSDPHRALALGPLSVVLAAPSSQVGLSHPAQSPKEAAVQSPLPGPTPPGRCGDTAPQEAFPAAALKATASHASEEDA